MPTELEDAWPASKVGPWGPDHTCWKNENSTLHNSSSSMHAGTDQQHRHVLCYAAHLCHWTEAWGEGAAGPHQCHWAPSHHPALLLSLQPPCGHELREQVFNTLAENAYLPGQPMHLTTGQVCVRWWWDEWTASNTEE